MSSRRLRLIGGVALGVAAQLSSIGLLLAAAWLIVRAAEHPPVLYLMVAIVAVRFFGISRSVLRYLERLVTHDVAFSDGVEQRIATYKELDRTAPLGWQRWRRGDVVNRVVADVAAQQDRLLRVQLNWWTGMAASIVVTAVLAWIDLQAGLVMALTVSVVAVLLRGVMSPRAAATRATLSDARSHLAAEVSAAAIAAPDLVAYEATGPSRARAHTATGHLASDQEAGARWAGAGNAVVLLATGCAVAAMAYVTGSVLPVVVGVLLIAPIALGESWDGWVEAERFRPDVEAAATRLRAFAALPSPVTDPPQPQPLPGDTSLSVDGLVVGWNEPLIEPVSFDVPAGATVGIAAPSGTGKSTLAYTLLRLIEPFQGAMRLGGIDLTAMRANDVRHIIGYVGQDEIVLDTTLRENLRVGDPNASEHQMLEALRRVGLGEFVAELPDGLDTFVGEHGNRLSGGERQRLCVARLLLSGHRIWILDEPTEHLDAPTAAALLDDVLSLAGDESGRTIMVISHAPWVLAQMQKVVELSAASGSMRQAGAGR